MKLLKQACIAAAFVALFSSPVFAVRDFTRHLELTGLLEGQPRFVRACRLIFTGIGAAIGGETPLWTQEKIWAKAAEALGQKDGLVPAALELHELCLAEKKWLRKRRILPAIYSVVIAAGVIGVLAWVKHRKQARKKRPDEISKRLFEIAHQLPMLSPYPGREDIAASVQANEQVVGILGEDRVRGDAAIELHNRWARNADVWLTAVREKMGDDTLTLPGAVNLARFGLPNLENLTVDDGYVLLRHFGRSINIGRRLSDREALAASIGWVRQLLGAPTDQSLLEVSFFIQVPVAGEADIRRIDFGNIRLNFREGSVMLFEPPLPEISLPYETLQGSLPRFNLAATAGRTVRDNFGLLACYARQENPGQDFTDQQALARGVEMLLENGVEEGDWNPFAFNIRDGAAVRHFDIKVRIADGRVGFNVPPAESTISYPAADGATAERMAMRAYADKTCPICLEDFHEGQTVVSLGSCGHVMCLDDALSLGHGPCPNCRAPDVGQRVSTVLPAHEGEEEE